MPQRNRDGAGLDLHSRQRECTAKTPDKEGRMEMDRTQTGAARRGSQSREVELDAEEVSMATLNQEGSPLQSVTGL